MHQRIISSTLPLAGLALLLFMRGLQLSYGWEVQQVPNFYTRLGDGLYWRNPSLYMADAQTGQLKRLDTSTNQVYICQIANENEATFIIPESNTDNVFLVGIRHYVGELQWDGVSGVCSVQRKLFSVETADKRDKANCMVDGRCDSKGRLYTGTANCKGDFSTLRHNLYKYSNGQLDTITNNLNISNGITFNEQKNEMYHVDSGANTITRYQYDPDTGATTNPVVVFKLDESTYPDNILNIHVLSSITMDTDGNLFVPVFGGKLLKISSDTWQVIDQYDLPCPYATFITFGGPNMDILYVATASEFFRDIDLPDICGNAFQILNTGSTGLPQNSCIVN